MPDVFVNYRTGDGEKTAIYLQEELDRRFGAGTAFRAGVSLSPGEPFPESLIRAVRRSDVLLAVIGRDWAAHPGLHRDGDWVRREILEAFAHGVVVIPLLDGRGVGRLRAADLPPGLSRLVDLQSIALDLQQDAKGSVGRVADALLRHIPSLKDRDAFAARPPAPGGKTMGDVNGVGVQSHTITGDVGTVIKGNHAPVHGGKGNLYNHSRHYENSEHHEGTA